MDTRSLCVVTMTFCQMSVNGANREQEQGEILISDVVVHHLSFSLFL